MPEALLPGALAVVAARRGDGSGTEFRAHSGRIWRGIDGRREFGRRDANSLDRHLRSRAVPGIRRGQPHGAAPSGDFLRRVVPCLCGESPRVDPVAGEVNATMLIARIRKERRGAALPPLSLMCASRFLPALRFSLDLPEPANPRSWIALRGWRGRTRDESWPAAMYCSIPRAESIFPRRSGEPPTFFRPWHYFRI